MNSVLMRILGSYGLALAMLGCLFVLTVFGTLYQVDNGLYDAKQTFFNSWFLTTAGGVPIFPGGVLVMLILAVNLVVGGLLRIRWRARNAGVIVIHIGIVFMLVSGLVKLTTAEEGHLTLFEGEEADVFMSYHDYEVAIWELGQDAQVPQWVIGDDFLADLGPEDARRFTAPDLPFTLVLSSFLENCNVLPVGPAWTPTGPVVDGFGFYRMASEKENERNLAGVHAEVVGADGSSQRGLLWERQRAPWAVEVDGRRFAIHFGHETYPMPFGIRLQQFIKEDHPGITMARAYKSRVMQVDGDGETPVLIQMNEPLRAGGLVLFQASYGPDTPGHEGPWFSTFSVVRNPSDKWPEYSLWVITAGLVWTFGAHLLAFLRKQAKRRAKAAAGETS